MLVAGCWLQVAGCRLQVAGCRLQVAGCWLQDIGYITKRRCQKPLCVNNLPHVRPFHLESYHLPTLSPFTHDQ
ncbi:MULTISPECIES: hypothetical protein [Moorena]|uniref:hypothetical protein n=1 Tax=unclassified Moorena TaxID=2683338 RepID=UPI0009D6BF77|nr:MULTISPECIES: hypothetical protein [Moorena]